MTGQKPEEDRTEIHTALTPGVMIGHYRIVDKIGVGGMGEVYLADDTKLDRKVALKFLPANMAQDGEVRARFTREARAAAKLDHPNIVTIYEVGEFDRRPFFAMQYVDGETLHHYCHHERVSVDRAIDFVLQVAEGLTKAHSAGVIHRDIKAINIIVDTDHRAKLLDFGLATVKGGEMLTKTGSTLGTVSYMSPEQAQGKEVDQRSDLFSLGIVLYELIAGRTPFRRTNDAATVHAIIHEDPDPLSRYAANVPDEIQRIVGKCLAKDPSTRYQSAADLAADLRAMKHSLSGIAPSSGQVAAKQPSIAVLPFANMSADPENEFFSDGLTEELLNVLAKNPELKVTGRTSSFAFKGKQEDLRGIGQKLGVGTLLEGSVRKAGNRVRITAQLVNTADGFHLWSETYDRVLDDIFAVQDDIAKAVADAMNVTLLGEKSKKQKPVNPESYALILRAHQAELQMSKSAMAQAHDLYRKAADIEPDNARAWAGMASTRLKQAAYGFADTKVAYLEGKKFAKKAIDLDDGLPEVHEAMGWTLAAFEHNFEEAGRYFRKALELSPNGSRQILSMSLYYLILGRFDESIKLAKRATELDPLAPDAFHNLGRHLLAAGRLSECRSAIEHALRLSPGLTTGHGLLAWAYAEEGRLDEALSEALKEEQAGYRNCNLAMIYHAMGKKAESDRCLNELLAHGEDTEWGFQIALVYAERGENDNAFKWLEQARSNFDAGIPLTKVSRHFRSLHDDPRWPAFLEKIGLAD